jgi:hypothetical protein
MSLSKLVPARHVSLNATDGHSQPGCPGGRARLSESGAWQAGRGLVIDTGCLSFLCTSFRLPCLPAGRDTSIVTRNQFFLLALREARGTTCGDQGCPRFQ